MRASQEASRPAGRDLELGVKVCERLKPGGQPCERHLIFAPPSPSSSMPRSVKYTAASRIPRRSPEPPARPGAARVTLVACPSLPAACAQAKFTSEL